MRIQIRSTRRVEKRIHATTVLARNPRQTPCDFHDPVLAFADLAGAFVHGAHVFHVHVHVHVHVFACRSGALSLAVVVGYGGWKVLVVVVVHA